MTTSEEILEAIDNAIADNEVSEDAMRWVPDGTARQNQVDDADGDGLTDLFGPVISAYTRADAIADGVLVEASSSLAREAGFRVPVALTSSVWADCVAWTEEDERRKRGCALQDEIGRLWDVLWMARTAVQHARDADTASFTIVRVPRGGRGVVPREVELRVAIGPGDQGEPVVTIMQPHED